MRPAQLWLQGRLRGLIDPLDGHFQPLPFPSSLLTRFFLHYHELGTNFLALAPALLLFHFSVNKLLRSL